MSIGIMDADVAKYTLVPFSLEAMKLSAYYKKKREIVVLSPTFSPERHEKFFYRKDYDDGDFPINLTAEPNVEYGGYAFTGGAYHPLPLDIEMMQPDTSLYSRMEELFMEQTNPKRKKIFQNMMTAEHCRISLDGKTVWDRFPKQFKCLRVARNLMLHDYNLAAIDGGFETIQELLGRARTDGWATRVGMKFPVQVSDSATLLKWSTLRSNSVFYSLKYTGVIDEEGFKEWIAHCREKAIYSQVEYYVTPSWYNENDFVMNLLPQIFRQVIISRSYRVFFTLNYDDDFFSDKRWCDVLRLFNYYHNSYSSKPESSYYKMIADDTMFNFAAASQKVPKDYYGDVLSTDQIREIFAFVREKNYELFKMFYECSARSIGGIL